MDNDYLSFNQKCSHERKIIESLVNSDKISPINDGLTDSIVRFGLCPITIATLLTNSKVVMEALEKEQFIHKNYEYLI